MYPVDKSVSMQYGNFFKVFVCISREKLKDSKINSHSCDKVITCVDVNDMS